MKLAGRGQSGTAVQKHIKVYVHKEGNYGTVEKLASSHAGCKYYICIYTVYIYKYAFISITSTRSAFLTGDRAAAIRKKNLHMVSTGQLLLLSLKH